MILDSKVLALSWNNLRFNN